MSPESARSLTVHVLWVAALLLLLFDVAIVRVAGVDASISVVLYEESRKHPIICGMLFLLIGHVFWPVVDK